MAVSTKAIKNRIKTVSNTKKITKAMQMIAAVKMRKAVDSAVSTREYADIAQDLLDSLIGKRLEHPLVEVRNEQKPKILMIMISSNRGLCGSYNSNVLKAGTRLLEAFPTRPEMIAVGRKSALFARRNKLKLLAIYEKLSDTPALEDVLPIVRSVSRDFLSKKYDLVYTLYTHFISGLKQEIKLKQLLPISGKTIKPKSRDTDGEDEEEYVFEPSKKQLLDVVLPKLVEVELYRAFLESSASEHSSRMIAMKNATESAAEMIDELTLEYNKGRQASITQELAEITGGAEALNYL